MFILIELFNFHRSLSMTCTCACIKYILRREPHAISSENRTITHTNVHLLRTPTYTIKILMSYYGMSKYYSFKMCCAPTLLSIILIFSEFCTFIFDICGKAVESRPFIRGWILAIFHIHWQCCECVCSDKSLDCHDGLTIQILENP